MKRTFKTKEFFLTAFVTGSVLFNVGNCTTAEVKAQFSKGFASTLTGLFNIASTDLADEVFDVDG